MKSFSLKGKLTLALSVLGLSMLAIGLIGYRMSIKDVAAMDDVFDGYFEAENQIATIALWQLDLNNQIVFAALTRSDAATSAMHARVNELRAAINKAWNTYQPTVTAGAERTLADEFIARRTKLVNQNDVVLAKMDAKQFDEALELYRTTSKPLLDSASEAAEKLLEYQVTTGRKVGDDNQDSAASSNHLMLAIILIAVALALLVRHTLVKTINAGFASAIRVAERIAGGHLDNNVTASTSDGFGRLLTAMSTLDTKLSEIVGQVATGANTVGNAARELALGNDDLSSRTQEQASALEETASSMEQMTATVKQTADNARQASQLAMAARTQANESGAVVSAAVNAMNEINQSSRRIADIISVIDEIAFQTNLLALNAAVEAARAGEQGRGFAVVASEVRNLAQRSATAAKEIKNLINDSVQKVADGTALVDRSGQTLAEIVDGIKKLTDVVAEISAAAQEQAAGIDQVNNAVTQMDQSTQQNAALVEQAASASKAMEQTAQQLIELIGFFKTSQSAQQLRPVSSMPQHAAAQPLPAPIKKPVSSVARATPKMARVAGGGGAAWTEF